MKIKEFAKKHNVDRRSVEYWTSCGYLHPEVLENGYRDFNEQCDEEMEEILIAVMLNEPGSLEEKLLKQSDFNSSQWSEIMTKLSKKRDASMKKYDLAYSAAKRRMRGE